MPTGSKADDVRLGFLTSIEVPGGGHMGGLLVTNRFGRPLEFQCTTPVQANRMQEILYGHTLVPFILSELIGTTLLDRIGVKPHMVLTEQEELLDVREHTSIPVAYIAETQSTDDEPPAEQEPTGAFRLGRQKLRFHAGHQDDQRAVESHTPAIAADADLREPFARVREALNETVRAAAGR